MYRSGWVGDSTTSQQGSGPVSAGRAQRKGARLQVAAAGRRERLARVGGRLPRTGHVVVQVAVRGRQRGPVAVDQVGGYRGLKQNERRLRISQYYGKTYVQELNVVVDP